LQDLNTKFYRENRRFATFRLTNNSILTVCDDFSQDVSFRLCSYLHYLPWHSQLLISRATGDAAA